MTQLNWGDVVRFIRRESRFKRWRVIPKHVAEKAVQTALKENYPGYLPFKAGLLAGLVFAAAT